MVVITFLLSLGKNLPIINKLIFDYLPLYNKFRTPNSVLSITAVFIPILAVLGLSELLKSDQKDKYIKPLYYATSILGIISLFFMLFGSSFMDFTAEADKNYGNIVDVLTKQRMSMMSSSAFRSFLLIILAAGSLWLFIKGKISQTLLLAAIGLFGFLDLFLVDKNYLGKQDFVTDRNYQTNFEPRPVDLQILNDKDPNFRVYDATINTFNAAVLRTFIKR